MTMKISKNLFSYLVFSIKILTQFWMNNHRVLLQIRLYLAPPYFLFASLSVYSALSSVKFSISHCILHSGQAGMEPNWRALCSVGCLSGHKLAGNAGSSAIISHHLLEQNQETM
jgi:hypothetical protein